MDKCNHCSQRFDKIESDLKKIIITLETILDTNAHINKSCSRMDAHIGFVDNVYQKVQEPLSWVVNRIGFRQTLPNISDTTNVTNDIDPNSPTPNES